MPKVKSAPKVVSKIVALGWHHTPEFGRPVEHRIVTALIRSVLAAGYKLESVWTGDEYVPVKTEREAMDAVFAVDDATLHFRDPRIKTPHNRGVFLVGGNGVDIICDWHCSDDKFNTAIEAVDSEAYA